MIMAASAFARLQFLRPISAHPLSRPFVVSFSPAITISTRLLGSAASVEPPNISDLCDKARICLTQQEVADIEPQLANIVDWFSQLQDVDLDNVLPAVRAGDLDEGSSLRSDAPDVFPEREAMIGAAPEMRGPFLKVPKILKENME